MLPTVIGALGTLEPDPVWQPQTLLPGERWAGGRLPPLLEKALEPWLAAAMRALNHRVPSAHLRLQSESVPLAGLCAALRERLAERMIFLAGECLECGRAGEPLDPAPLDRTHPALASLLRATVAAWVDATALFLARLHADSDWLAASLGLPRLPPLAEVSAAASDVHPGAGVVLRLAFAGGACLYYKPRPVSGEWLWAALLDTLHGLDPGLRLPAARIHCRPQRMAYGWQESVLATEVWPGCAPPPTARPGFWHNAGAVLCLAQHVRLTDLHLGNVLATPHGPAVFDAECLATPEMHSGAELGEAGSVAAHLRLLRATGLVADRVADGAPDISGLFGRGGAAAGVAVPRWAVSGKGFRLVAAPARLAAYANAPPVSSSLATVAPVCEGYRHAAELLLRARPHLLDRGTPWRGVLEAVHAPRAMPRDTLAYAVMLGRSLGPAQLRSVPLRRKTLAALLTAGDAELPRAALRAEVRMLAAGCIPRWHILAGTRTLSSGERTPLVRGFARQTPAAAVLSALDLLSAARIREQQMPALIAAFL